MSVLGSSAKIAGALVRAGHSFAVHLSKAHGECGMADMRQWLGRCLIRGLLGQRLPLPGWFCFSATPPDNRAGQSCAQRAGQLLFAPIPGEFA